MYDPHMPLPGPDFFHAAYPAFAGPANAGFFPGGHGPGAIPIVEPKHGKAFNAPQGGIHPGAKQALEASRANSPRYLFRGFSARSGGGDRPEWRPPKVSAPLNDRRGCRPHAFVKGKGHKSIYQISSLKGMLFQHLGEGKTLSEFSSWAASLAAAVSFGRKTAKGSPVFVAIVDTKYLAPHQGVYYCPQLHKAGLTDAPYAEEYLIHGVVDGQAYAVIDYHASYPGPWTHYLGTMGGKPTLQQMPGIEPFRKAKRTALGFAEAMRKNNPQAPTSHTDELVVVGMIGILSCIPGVYQHGNGVAPEHIANIERILNEHPAVPIPSSFKNEKSIMTNCVSVTNFPDLRWSILALRTLANRQGSVNQPKETYPPKAAQPAAGHHRSHKTHKPRKQPRTGFFGLFKK